MARDKRPDEVVGEKWGSFELGAFIEGISGGELKAPTHLGRYWEAMHHLAKGELRICVSMPPQHAKTTTCQYAIAHTLLPENSPGHIFGYGSYAKLFASDRTEEIRDIFMGAGGVMKLDHNRKDNWRNEQGGGCISFSPDSSITGYKVHTLVLDDIVHDADDLDTEEKRQKLRRFLHVITQRLWVGGSILAIGTRWHPEDPIGILLERGYEEINLPAIREDADGNEHALWPDVKPLTWLRDKRSPSSVNFVGAYEWATQYQGRPVPREGAVFGPPRWYDDLPPGASVRVIGFDFGYGPEGSSDFSVAVVLAYLDGVYYVHDVLRVRTTLEAMASAFKGLMSQHPYPVRYGCYMGGNEKGILNLLFQEDVAIERMPARHNKYTRAQRCASAWRSGRVLVRKGQPWSAKFAREVEFFTGNEKGHDDQVDALVAGFDLVELNAPVGWAGSGFSFGQAVM